MRGAWPSQGQAGLLTVAVTQVRRQWRRPGLDGPNLADPEFGFAALGSPQWSAATAPSVPGVSCCVIRICRCQLQRQLGEPSGVADDIEQSQAIYW